MSIFLKWYFWLFNFYFSTTICLSTLQSSTILSTMHHLSTCPYLSNNVFWSICRLSSCLLDYFSLLFTTLINYIFLHIPRLYLSIIIQLSSRLKFLSEILVFSWYRIERYCIECTIWSSMETSNNACSVCETFKTWILLCLILAFHANH